MRAWLNMTLQAMIDVEDAAVLRAYLDSGVPRVKWIAELDGRECAVCRKRNNKIYPIDSVPGKPHFRCRCYLQSVLSEKGDADD